MQESKGQLTKYIFVKVCLAPKAMLPTSIPEYFLRTAGANQSFCSIKTHPRKDSISILTSLEKEILESLVAVLPSVCVNF